MRVSELCIAKAMARAAEVLDVDTAAFPDERFQTLAPREALGLGAPLVTVYTCQFAACPVGRDTPYTGREALLLAQVSAGTWKVGHKQCWLHHVRQLDESRVRRLAIGPRPAVLNTAEARAVDALSRDPVLNDITRAIVTHAKDRIDLPPGGWPITNASQLGFRVVLHGISEHATVPSPFPLDGFVNIIAYATSLDGAPPWPSAEFGKAARFVLPSLRLGTGGVLSTDLQITDAHIGMGTYRRVVRVGALCERARRVLQDSAGQLLARSTLCEWQRKHWSGWPELGEWHRKLIDAAVYWCGSNRVPVVINSASDVLVDAGGNQIVVAVNMVAPRENPRLVLVDGDRLALIRDAVHGRLPLCMSGAQLEAAIRAGECILSQEWPCTSVNKTSH